MWINDLFKTEREPQVTIQGQTDTFQNQKQRAMAMSNI